MPRRRSRPGRPPPSGLGQGHDQERHRHEPAGRAVAAAAGPTGPNARPFAEPPSGPPDGPGRQRDRPARSQSRAGWAKSIPIIRLFSIGPRPSGRPAHGSRRSRPEESQVDGQEAQAGRRPGGVSFTIDGPDRPGDGALFQGVDLVEDPAQRLGVGGLEGPAAADLGHPPEQCQVGPAGRGRARPRRGRPTAIACRVTPRSRAIPAAAIGATGRGTAGSSRPSVSRIRTFRLDGTPRSAPSPSTTASPRLVPTSAAPAGRIERTASSRNRRSSVGAARRSG